MCKQFLEQLMLCCESQHVRTQVYGGKHAFPIRQRDQLKQHVSVGQIFYLPLKIL
jgi:hypothetical protein